MTQPDERRRQLVPNAVLAEAVTSAGERTRMDLPEDEDTPFWMIAELNLRHVGVLEGARAAFLSLIARLFPGRPTPELVTNTNYRLRISVAEARALVAEEEVKPFAERSIYRIWPDFPLEPLVDRSTPTVKADAAHRAYAAEGQGITWAVIDSRRRRGILHFSARDTLGGPVAGLHRDFTLDGEPGPESAASALVDGFGHGSHVAGIIAGAFPSACRADAGWWWASTTPGRDRIPAASPCARSPTTPGSRESPRPAGS